MTKLERAACRISDAVGQAKQPALLFSGGKESMVLWWLCRPHKLQHVFFYDELQPERFRFVEELYKDTHFEVLNFRPMLRTLVPTKEGLDLVNVYDLRGEGMLEVAISPHQRGDYCVFDWLALPVRNCPDFCFDTLIVGLKKNDTHDYYTQERSPREPERKLGENITLVSPLYDWTDDDVWQAIREHNIPYDKNRYDGGSTAHSDNLDVCVRCILETGDIECPRGGMVNAEAMKVKALKELPG